MNFEFREFVHHSDMYELIRFMYKHIWQVQKGQSKKWTWYTFNFWFDHLHFKKYLNLSHSVKCSVSTQLTYMQKIQYNKASISTTRTNFEITENSLSTLKNDNFASSVIFAIPDFLDFWVSCHFGFLLFWYHFANFTKPTLNLKNFGFCLNLG